MARVLVIGAGVGGLTTAMLLGRDGHDVTVLERDAAPVPTDNDTAWRSWDRRGVNQFRLLHYFLPRFRAIVESELPEVPRELDRAGALRFNPFKFIPDAFTGGWREGDERFEALTGRRPVVEAALARVAADTKNVTIRRGVAVRSLIVGEPIRDLVRVVGVRTDEGEELRADLVVDVSGRRSALPGLLADAGAPRPIEEVEDSGFLYYGRHFRSNDGSVPALMGPLLYDCDTISLLTLPADNGAWGIGVITSAKDKALRGLRDVHKWTDVVSAFPLAAHWLNGEPLSPEVDVIAKIEDRHRSFEVDGKPVACGIVAVGDSWACTNPSLGRGASVGAIHAVALRDLIHQVGVDDLYAFAEEWNAVTEVTVEPWYRETNRYDRHRVAEIDAAVQGEPYEPGDDEFELARAMAFAGGSDFDIFRRSLDVVSLLTTLGEIAADTELRAKVMRLGGSWREAPLLGPSRKELLDMVTS